jgi:hypothetical protein
MLALDDLHDAPLGAAVGAPALDARKNAITIHCVAETVAAYEEIAIDSGNWMIRYEKSIAVAMRDDAPGD